jgi:hypothetical protein
MRLLRVSFFMTTDQPGMDLSCTKKTCDKQSGRLVGSSVDCAFPIHTSRCHIGKSEDYFTCDAKAGSRYGFVVSRGLAAMFANQKPCESRRSLGRSSVCFATQETTIKTMFRFP